MTNAIETSSAAMDARRRHLLEDSAIAMVASCMSGGLGWALRLDSAGLVLLALGTVLLLGAHGSTQRRWTAWGLPILGVMIAMSALLGREGVAIGLIVGMSVMLLSFGWMVASIARVIGGPLAVGVCGLWLSVPLWGLSHVTSDRLRQGLINVHAGMVGSSLMTPDAPWSHRPRAYRIMSLGQDVPYRLPTSISGPFALHAGVAGLCIGAARLTQRNARDQSDESSDVGSVESLSRRSSDS